MALMERNASGLGQHVDVSMMSGALSFQVEALAYLNAGHSAEVGQTRLTGRYPCYRIYRTSDDRFMAVAATEVQFWRNLCELLEVPELVDLQYAEGRAADDATSMLEERFATRTVEEWEQVLVGSETCCTPVLTPDEAIEYAAKSGNEVLIEDEHAHGDVRRQFLSPVTLSRTPATYRLGAPELDNARPSVIDELEEKS
jgi:crotonobetainyl-CoA:carnitine CoA-transferase CaiB-like acyl-CoA transferase